MDLYIETLTGTVFELRVSPFETIFSIKSKVQRLEGIPISQQHLIWQNIQLDDEYCLHDYNIGHGATLKLVLAMRGGPINTRRVSVEDPSLQEMADYMDANKDEIWETLMQDNQQVTLLVFRDGDQLNFFRVYDRGDGTLTPYTESISPHSDDGQDAEVSDGSDQDLKQENAVTKDKMRLLQEQLALKSGSSKNSSAVGCVPVPPSQLPKSVNTALSKRRLHFSKSSSTSMIPIPSRHGVVPKTESAMHGQYDITELTPSPTKALDLQHRNSRLGAATTSRSEDHVTASSSDSATETTSPKKESVRRRILPPLKSNGKQKDASKSQPGRESTTGLATMHSISENLPHVSNEPKRRVASKSSLHRASASGTKSKAKSKAPLPLPGDDDDADVGAGILPNPGHTTLPRINVNQSMLNQLEPEPIKEPVKPTTSSKKLTPGTKKPSRRRLLKPLGTLEARSPNADILSSTTPPELRDLEAASVDAASKQLDMTSAGETPGPAYCGAGADLDEILKEAQLQELLRDSVEYEHYKKLLSWVRPPPLPPRHAAAAGHEQAGYEQPGPTSVGYHTYTGEDSMKDPTNGRMDNRIAKRVPSRSSAAAGKTSPETGRRSTTRLQRSSKVNLHGPVAGGYSGGHPGGHLPPVGSIAGPPPSLASKKKRPRCEVCTKKLGLATTYHCRCGSAFCGVHRYPEAHPCSFDFKSEGREILQKSNPVVAAPKLPKI